MPRLAGIPVRKPCGDALHLDDAERAYLFDLARAANEDNRPARRLRSAPRRDLRPSLHWMLAGMTDAPAFIRNGRLDILATSPPGRALYAPVSDSSTTAPGAAPNAARFRFFDPAAHDFFPAWAESANTSVAILRAEIGHNPYDKELTDLIGELSARSEDFRVPRAAHNVRRHATGTKRFHHPMVGDLSLAFDAMNLTSDPGLTLTVYSAEPGSPSADTLALLASWTADDTRRRVPRPRTDADERSA